MPIFKKANREITILNITLKKYWKGSFKNILNGEWEAASTIICLRLTENIKNINGKNKELLRIFEPEEGIWQSKARKFMGKAWKHRTKT